MLEIGHMRVVLITNTFMPHAGGSRFYYYNLIKRLADMGDEVIVSTSKVPGWQAFDAQTRTFRIERHFKPLRDNSFAQLPKGMGPLFTATALALFRRPGVLHCGDLYPAGLIGVMLKKVLGIPFVAYCHGEDITHTDVNRYQPRVRNLIYESADAIVASSDFAVENLGRIGFNGTKVHKLTPAVDTSVFFPESPDAGLRERYGIGDALVVMTVARLIPRKGHDRIIRALAALDGQVPPFKYVIVGGGSREAELRALTAALKLQDKVIFAGIVAGEDLNRHYNLADIMAMPNIEIAGDLEGFGMVFLEANAAGKPVIGGRSGGAAGAVADGESGFLVDAGHEGELIVALRKLLTDGALRRDMGREGLRRVRAEFAWESRAAMLKQINDDVARQRQQ